MFLAMADDYRVILVKLADKASGFVQMLRLPKHELQNTKDRLHNMRTLQYM